MCTSPLHGFMRPDGGFTLSPRLGYRDQPMTVACGGCLQCKMSRSGGMALRLLHEKRKYDPAANFFATLTFNERSLPHDNGLHSDIFQRFHKRIRITRDREAAAEGRVASAFKYVCIGEYGDKNGRPHGHTIFLGLELPDLVPDCKSQTGEPLWRSPWLDKLWGMSDDDVGVRLGTVTEASCKYVTRYCLKKIGSRSADADYLRPHPDTGELHQVAREFLLCSRGIGADFIDNYARDAFPSGFLTNDGSLCAVPRYYKDRVKRLVEENGSHAGVTQADLDQLRIAQKAVLRSENYVKNSTRARLETRAEVLRLRVEKLKREI